MKFWSAKPKSIAGDGVRLDIGGVTVRLSVSRRARRVSLRIDPTRRELIAIAPSEKLLPDALAFARERRSWARERLEALPEPTSVEILDALVVFGTRHSLVPDGRRPRVLNGVPGAQARLTGCGDGVVDRMLVVRAVRREALRVFTARARIHCAALEVSTPRISVADARTRWGSCSPATSARPASIRLSWRLSLAPFEVADYVVAHECAHLIEANHGPRFWAVVNRLVGDPLEHRAWLRTHGAGLHAFGA